MQLGRSLAVVPAILAAATVAACTSTDNETLPAESPAAQTAPSLLENPSILEEPMRIEFAPDDNTADETGRLPSGGVARYVLAAEAGQILDAKVESSQPPVVLSIVGADGSELQSVSAFAQDWSGPLPTTQDYYLDLNAPTAGGSEYSLTVSLGE